MLPSFRSVFLWLLFALMTGLTAQNNELTISRFSLETFVPFDPAVMYGASERTRYYFGIPENTPSAEVRSKKAFMGKLTPALTTLKFYPTGNLKSHKYEYLKENGFLYREYDEKSGLLIESRRLDAGTLFNIHSELVRADSLVKSVTYYYESGVRNKEVDTVQIMYAYFPNRKIKSEEYLIATYDKQRIEAKHDFHYDENDQLTAVTKNRERVVYLYKPAADGSTKQTEQVTDTLVSLRYDEQSALVEFRRYNDGVPVFFSTFTLNLAGDVLYREDRLTRSTYGREIDERKAYSYQKSEGVWVKTSRLNQLKGRKYRYK